MESIAEYGWLVLALLGGTFTHVLKKVVEKRKSDSEFSLKSWLTAYPYKTLLTVMAGVVGFLGLQATGELTGVSSFMVGYMANSLGGAAE